MVSDWGEVVTRYPYGNVRMDHLLSKEKHFLYSIDNVQVTLSIMDIGNYIVEETSYFVYARSIYEIISEEDINRSKLQVKQVTTNQGKQKRCSRN